MQKDEIIKGICEELVKDDLIVGFRYDHFEQSDAVEPPFAVYRRVAPDNFSADGIVYHRGDNVDFEIYASDPDEMINIMAAAEEAMTDAGLYFAIAADTAYIESEDFYETLYEL